jgi:four helix bundle protein
MSERQPTEETEVFRLFDEVSDSVWDIVANWDSFAKKVIGIQLITSLDSLVANLVEGDGRYRPNDALQFFVIARASAREGKLWIQRRSREA